MCKIWICSLGQSVLPWVVYENPCFIVFYPLLHFGQENAMDCIVHGVAKSWIQLSNFHFTFTFSHLWLCLSTLPVSKGENVVSHWYFNFHFLDPYCAWFSHVSIDYLDFVFMNYSHLLLVFLSVCIFFCHFAKVLYVLMLLFTSVNMLQLCVLCCCLPLIVLHYLCNTLTSGWWGW